MPHLISFIQFQKAKEILARGEKKDAETGETWKGITGEKKA